MVETIKVTIRRKSISLLYDLDINPKQSLFRVDLTLSRNGEDYPTPLPQLFTNRFKSDVNPRSLPARPKGLELRRYQVCTVINDVPVTRTVYNPYRPTDDNCKNLGKQLISISSVEALNYKGETFNSKLEAIV